MMFNDTLLAIGGWFGFAVGIVYLNKNTADWLEATGIMVASILIFSLSGVFGTILGISLVHTLHSVFRAMFSVDMLLIGILILLGSLFALQIGITLKAMMYHNEATADEASAEDEDEDEVSTEDSTSADEDEVADEDEESANVEKEKESETTSADTKIIDAVDVDVDVESDSSKSTIHVEEVNSSHFNHE